MSITVFGIIWFVILIVLFFVPVKYTIGALMISTIVQSTAVINLEDKGITATLITEVYLVIRFLLMKKNTKEYINDRDKKSEKLIKGLVLFFIISSILSVFSSIIFKNLYVYNKFSERNPINIGINTSLIIRIIILFFNIVSLYVIYRMRNLYDNKFIKKVFVVSILIVLFFGFWEFIWKITNKKLYFPYELIYNNVGYSQGYDQGYIEGRSNLTNVRMNSIFLEPSYCGCFLVASLYGIIAVNNEKRYNKLIGIIGIAIILNLSGTGILLLVITGIYYLFINNKDKIKMSTIIKLFLVGTFFVLILGISGYIERIMDMLLNKMDSISGIQRSYYNKIAWQLAIRTYFIGGGLNCYRASSFFYNLLGTVGIIGTTIFLYNMIIYLYRIRLEVNTNKYYKSGYYYLITVLIGMFISIPDITYLQMWFALMYLVAINNTESEEKNEKSRSCNIKL